MTRLEFARRNARLTQTQVAHEVLCSPSLVSLIERRLRNPRESIARKLAIAVGIDPAKWESLQNQI